MSTSTSNLFFLIGFMGSGKSLLSRGVAQSGKAIHVEMDEAIERKAGRTINQIFAQQGEDAFRKLERQVLFELIDKFKNNPQIALISTGGGAPCHFDNIKVMNRAGTTIFLNPSVVRLAARLEPRKYNRPLIKDRSTDEIRAFIANKLEKRMFYYSQADITVNMVSDDKTRNIRFLADIVSAAVKRG